jgi:UDP:flavonoid glycosyltransferase YjiC (YdhE family)
MPPRGASSTVAACPASGVLPPWWGEMLEDDRPVVLVTQGTVATDARELVLPTLEGLRDEPVQVIATTGGPDPAAVAGGDLPANARLERFVPFAPLMPHVRAFVTNGGYGGLHFALGHGVPTVVAGKTEDKAELVARVSWSGVGVGMRKQAVRPAEVRAAVRRVLREPGFRARAGALQAEMAASGGPARSAQLLERLGATGRPVLRDYDATATAGAGVLAGASS